MGGVLRRRLGELPYLVGYHGKATAGVPGMGRLDRRVHGQKVGLGGDLVDNPDGLDNVVDARPYLADYLVRVGNPVPSGGGYVDEGRDRLPAVLGDAGDARNRRAHLLDRG